jgi:hypothetical protein
MTTDNPTGGASYSPPTSSMALICLIAGLLGLTFFPLVGSIVAVITGPMAKREIRDSAGALGGEGIASVGVILGWVGIGLALLGCCIAAAVFAMMFALIPWFNNSSSMMIYGLLAMI